MHEEKSQVAEKKPNLSVDINGYPTDNHWHRMEMQQSTPEKRKAKTAYPLRFRSKAQKERLEKAAKRVHKTLRDFLLDLGDKAVAETGDHQQAS